MQHEEKIALRQLEVPWVFDRQPQLNESISMRPKEAIPMQSKFVKKFTLRAPAEAIGRKEAKTIGEPVRSVSQGIDGL